MGEVIQFRACDRVLSMESVPFSERPDSSDSFYPSLQWAGGKKLHGSVAEEGVHAIAAGSALGTVIALS